MEGAGCGRALWRHRPTEGPYPEGTAMKALLWLTLALAVIVNVFTSFAFEGVQQVLISVPTGLVAITAAVALFLTRRRTAA